MPFLPPSQQRLSTEGTSFHCLGHFKNVYDDDGNDDAPGTPTATVTPGARARIRIVFLADQKRGTNRPHAFLTPPRHVLSGHSLLAMSNQPAFVHSFIYK